MIGRVGTMFGDAGVNIANMAVSRTKQGGEALMAFAIDSRAAARARRAHPRRRLQRRPLHRARLSRVRGSSARTSGSTNGCCFSTTAASPFASTTAFDPLVLVAVGEQERRAVGSDALVLLERRVDPLGAARVSALADELGRRQSNCSAVSAIRSLTSRNSDSVFAIFSASSVVGTSSPVWFTRSANA